MTVVQKPRDNERELGERARNLYERLRAEVETPENVGKLIVLDMDSGDYEIDETVIAPLAGTASGSHSVRAAHRLQDSRLLL
jgi:hypothetical protein